MKPPHLGQGREVGMMRVSYFIYQHVEFLYGLCWGAWTVMIIYFGAYKVYPSPKREGEKGQGKT